MNRQAEVGQAIVFCGLPSSVGRTGAPTAFVGPSAFFWPVESILGHYWSAALITGIIGSRPVAGYERGVSFQLATSASSPTFFAGMPARTPAWQGAHKPGGRPGPLHGSLDNR